MDELVPPDVVLLPGDGVARATEHDDALDVRGLGARLIGVYLQRDLAALAPALVLGDQELGARVAKALGERLGGEPAEDDDVRRADPGARQHRGRKLRTMPM
jgi:hypothetical protein